MKKTYIAPLLQVDEAEVEGLLMEMSISLSNESGSEEYAKEIGFYDEDWDED